MIFKSPLRRRIEKRIKDLTLLRNENAKKRMGNTHKTEEYSKLLLEDISMEKEIKALNNVL